MREIMRYEGSANPNTIEKRKTQQEWKQWLTWRRSIENPWPQQWWKQSLTDSLEEACMYHQKKKITRNLARKT